MQDTDDPMKVTIRITERWAEAFNSGKLNDLSALYAENAYFSSSRTSLLRGRRAIEQYFETMIKMGWRAKIVARNAHAVDAAVIVGCGAFALVGSGRRLGEQILGSWGITLIGKSPTIAMHISNDRGSIRDDVSVAIPQQPEANWTSSYARPY
jgi:hypothetical protein